MSGRKLKFGLNLSSKFASFFDLFWRLFLLLVVLSFSHLLGGGGGPAKAKPKAAPAKKDTAPAKRKRKAVDSDSESEDSFDSLSSDSEDSIDSDSDDGSDDSGAMEIIPSTTKSSSTSNTNGSAPLKGILKAPAKFASTDSDDDDETAKGRLIVLIF